MPFCKTPAVLALLLATGATHAQPASKPYRVGYLSVQAQRSENSESFVRGLRELGYIEGRDVVIEHRWAKGDNARLPALAADLVRAKVDVIVAAGTASTIAAQRATLTIPIVFGSASDPVEKGLVASLAHPGRNVTGLALQVDLAKHIQVLKETFPHIVRVGVLYDPTVIAPENYRRAYFHALDEKASALHITVRPFAVSGLKDTERAVADMRRAGTEGIIVHNPSTLLAEAKGVCALAMQYRLPSIGAGREFANAGCLMGYGENLPDMYRRAAFYVDKILKGASPGDLPVEQPSKFDFVVNLKTAKTLGVEIPKSLLLRADRIID